MLNESRSKIKTSRKEYLNKIGYLYTITHNDSGKFYVGITSQKPQLRWSAHKSTVKTKITYKSKLVMAMRKYGIENFTFKVEMIFNTMIEAGEMEIYLKRELNAEYNILPGGQLGPLGIPWSEETRAKALASRAANKKPKPQSAIDATVAFHTGRKRPKETCERISQAGLGRVASEEASRNNRQAQQRRWDKFFLENPDKKGRRTRAQRDRENEQERERRRKKKENKNVCG